jgi:hypothetical protein
MKKGSALRCDIWFSDGGQAGILSSSAPERPVRAVLYDPHPDQDGWQILLKLDDRSVVPLNVPLSGRAAAMLSRTDWLYFGVVEGGLVTESFAVPLARACSDTHWTGLDGSSRRARRTIPGFMAFMRARVFGEPLHVPDGREYEAPSLPCGRTTPPLSARLAFWGQANKERPSSLGRAWQTKGQPAGSSKGAFQMWQMA